MARTCPGLLFSFSLRYSLSGLRYMNQSQSLQCTEVFPFAHLLMTVSFKWRTKCTSPHTMSSTFSSAPDSGKFILDASINNISKCISSKAVVQGKLHKDQSFINFVKVMFILFWRKASHFIHFPPPVKFTLCSKARYLVSNMMTITNNSYERNIRTYRAHAADIIRSCENHLPATLDGKIPVISVYMFKVALL